VTDKRTRGNEYIIKKIEETEKLEEIAESIMKEVHEKLKNNKIL
jgi:hypothetical protein